MRKKVKAQSMLEYALVLTAVVGLLIWAAGSLIKPRVEAGLQNTQDAITNAAAKMP